MTLGWSFKKLLRHTFNQIEILLEAKATVDARRQLDLLDAIALATMAGNGGEKQFKNYRQSLMNQAFGVQIKNTSEDPLRAIKRRAKKNQTT